jgi:hypothetical protein
MPIYQFQNDAGSIIERFYRAEKAPPLGTRIRHNKRWYTRIISTGVTTADARMRSHDQYPYLSSRHSPHTPGAEAVRDPRTGKTKLLIESAKHEREFMARNGLVRE